MWTDGRGASLDALCDHAEAAVREIECFGEEPTRERRLRRWSFIFEERAPLAEARLSEALPPEQRAVIHRRLGEIHTGTAVELDEVVAAERTRVRFLAPTPVHNLQLFCQSTKRLGLRKIFQLPFLICRPIQCCLYPLPISTLQVVFPLLRPHQMNNLQWSIGINWID